MIACGAGAFRLMAVEIYIHTTGYAAAMPWSMAYRVSPGRRVDIQLGHNARLVKFYCFHRNLKELCDFFVLVALCHQS